MIRCRTTWVCVGVKGEDLEGVLAVLLGRFHGDHPPSFEVYNTWNLLSPVQELYMSPVAFTALAESSPPRYQVRGLATALPTHCDLLMGNQTQRSAGVTDMPAYFRTAAAAPERRRFRHRRDRN